MFSSIAAYREGMVPVSIVSGSEPVDGDFEMNKRLAQYTVKVIAFETKKDGLRGVMPKDNTQVM